MLADGPADAALGNTGAEVLNAVEEVAQEVVKEVGLLGSEALWTLLLAGCVLAIGQSYESLEHTLKHRLPKTLLPVLGAVTGEIATVGFSGLVINTLENVGFLQATLEPLSEQYFGKGDELLEIFESIEQALFPATMSFVAACTVVIGIVTVSFERFAKSTQTELLLAKLAADAEREACLDTFADAEMCNLARTRSQESHGLLLSSLRMESDTPQARAASSTPLGAIADAFAELRRPASDWRAEFLRFRARFIEQGSVDFGVALPPDFQFGKYLQLAAAENLKQLVSIEPKQLVQVWLPLIALEVALLEVLEPSTITGNFLPSVIALSQLPIGVWTVWNYLRLNTIKRMLRPQLGELFVGGDGGGGGGAGVAEAAGILRADTNNDGNLDTVTKKLNVFNGADTTGDGKIDTIYKLLPPRYAFLGSAFLQPTWLDTLGFIEKAFAPKGSPLEQRSSFERLFGALGKNGLNFYKSSVKLNLFSAVVSLAYIGSGGCGELQAAAAADLAPRLAAFVGAAEPSASLVPPLAAFLALITWLPAGLTIALTPFTFLSFNWASCVEQQRKPELVETILREQRSERFRVTLSTLASLCAWVERTLPDVCTADEADVEAAWEAMLATVRPERLLDVRAVFEAQDTDSSGSIGLEEVGAVVKSLGYTPSEDDVQRLFEHMDVDGSGQIGYKEFATVVLGASATGAGGAGAGGAGAGGAGDGDELSAAAQERLFRFFDSDGSGVIEESEMLEKLGKLGFDRTGVTQLFSQFQELAGDEVRDKGVTRLAFASYLRQASLLVTSA